MKFHKGRLLVEAYDQRNKPWVEAGPLKIAFRASWGPGGFFEIDGRLGWFRWMFLIVKRKVI